MTGFRPKKPATISVCSSPRGLPTPTLQRLRPGGCDGCLGPASLHGPRCKVRLTTSARICSMSSSSGRPSEINPCRCRPNSSHTMTRRSKPLFSSFSEHSEISSNTSWAVVASSRSTLRACRPSLQRRMAVRIPSLRALGAEGTWPYRGTKSPFVPAERRSPAVSASAGSTELIRASIPSSTSAAPGRFSTNSPTYPAVIDLPEPYGATTNSALPPSFCNREETSRVDLDVGLKCSRRSGCPMSS